MARFTEEDATFAILGVIRNGEPWTNASIKSALERGSEFSDEDRSRANERENEPKWFTIVNNCLQDGRGLYKLGWVERIGRGEHRITDKGKSALARHEHMVETFTKQWGDFLPDASSS